MTDKLLVARDGPICTITLNQPAKLNAVDTELMAALREAVLGCGADGTTRVIVLTGAGGAFCSGADVSFAVQPDVSPDSLYRMLREVYHPAILAIHESPCPIVAAVDGIAAGIGCDIALACDVRLASERARFAELFIRVGLLPDGGGTWSLPRIVGMGRALELMYSGEALQSEQALAIGLANKVFRVERFADEVAGYAARLAGQAPQALARIRRAVRAAQESTFAESLAREAALQREILAREDG